ncbi:MAG: alkaline phosphatase [Fimbriimonadaceae bacterium]
MRSDLSRRHLLGMGAAAAATGFLGLPSLSFAKGREPASRAKNIIYCCSDGMPVSIPAMLNDFVRIRDGRESVMTWLARQEFAVTGLQETRSLSSLVTDSAAAGSAWGCGRHVWNGQLNCFPDGTKLRTLYDVLKEDGMRTGLVTTATMTHATPSGFSVNMMRRDDEPGIAEAHLERGVDVLLGGGDRFFNPQSRRDGRDLYAEFERKGYTVARNRSELVARAAVGQKLLGIFSTSHVPYTIDRDNNPELRASVPTLAEMTRIAIDRLKTGPKGFILQVEGARIDHAGHANDIAGMLYDQLAFEEAVKVAIDFAMEDGETLVVVTGDHGTGGPALNGAGIEYGDTASGLEKIAAMKGSFDAVTRAIGREANAAKVKDVAKEILDLEFSNAEAEAVAQAAANNSPFRPSAFFGGLTSALGLIVGNHVKATFTSGNHTADHTPVIAMGPGSELFAGWTSNISHFDRMLATRGLKWENPTMSFEEARRHMSARQERALASAVEEHWY